MLVPGSRPKKATTAKRLTLISASEKCLPDTYVDRLTYKGSSDSYRNSLHPSQRLFLYCDSLPLCFSRKALYRLHNIQPLFQHHVFRSRQSLCIILVVSDKHHGRDRNGHSASIHNNCSSHLSGNSNRFGNRINTSSRGLHDRDSDTDITTRVTEEP